MEMKSIFFVCLAMASLITTAPIGFVKDLFKQFKTLEKQASPTAVLFTTTESTINTAYKVTVTRITATWTRSLASTAKTVVTSVTSTVTVARTAAIFFFDGDSVGVSSLPPTSTSKQSLPSLVYTPLPRLLTSPTTTSTRSLDLNIPQSPTTSAIPQLHNRQGIPISSSSRSAKMYLLINDSFVPLPSTSLSKTSIISAEHDEYYKDFYEQEKKAAEREKEEMKAVRQRKLCDKLKAMADSSSRRTDSRNHAGARSSLLSAAKDAAQVTKATFKHVVDRMRPWFGSNPHR